VALQLSFSPIADSAVANARRVDEQVYNQPPQKTQADNTTDMNPTELLGQIFSSSSKATHK